MNQDIEFVGIRRISKRDGYVYFSIGEPHQGDVGAIAATPQHDYLFHDGKYYVVISVFDHKLVGFEIESHISVIARKFRRAMERFIKA